MDLYVFSLFINNGLNQSSGHWTLVLGHWTLVLINILRSIKDWNNLPSSIIESNNIDSFSAELQTLYRTQ